MAQIERAHDPRHVISPHPLHNHNPWADAPDPEEGDIEHVEWNSGPTRLHFTRTSFRSSSPSMNQGGPELNDPYAPILHTVTSLLGGFPGAPNRQPQIIRGTGNLRNMPPSMFGPFGGPGSGPHFHQGPAFPPMSPLQEGPGRQVFGGRNVYTATARLRPRDANNPQPQIIPVDDLHGYVSSVRSPCISS